MVVKSGRKLGRKLSAKYSFNLKRKNANSLRISVLTFVRSDNLPSKRKLGDSNPRYPCEYVSLANWWFQPLTQTSFTHIISQMRCKYRMNFWTMQIFLQ